MSFSVDGDRVAAGGRDDRLLTWDRVKDITGISRTTAWRMQKAGDFPEPVTISAKRVGWWESELTAWKATRTDNRRSRALAPPRAPKLIETARSPRPATGAVPPTEPVSAEAPVSSASATRDDFAPASAQTAPSSIQPSLPLGAPADAAAVKPKRRKRAVSPDQIDFGF